MRILLFCALIASALIAAAGWYRGAVHDELTAEQTLERVARSFGQGGYEITLTGHNLVLPQWGGIDGLSTVEVASDGRAARAKLVRTGEPDATYEVVLVDNETFFKRSTCNDWFRIPSGGARVLVPFFLDTSLVAEDGYVFRAPEGASLVIEARLADLGDVAIVVDPSDWRVGAIHSNDPERDDGAVFDLTFRDWGETPEVERPSGDIQDRGPGGIPC